MHNATYIHKALGSRISSIASPFLETSTLLRLTPIRPPTLGLLIPTHTRTQSKIHPRRSRKPKALGDLDETQLMHIEDSPQTMARVGLEIATVAVLGGFVQVVVLANELLQLRLHIHDLLGRELEFDYGNSRRFEMCEEAHFGGLEEHEGPAAAVGTSCCASDAVDVIAGIVRRVKLNDP
jgi:hypothetical protein